MNNEVSPNIILDLFLDRLELSLAHEKEIETFRESGNIDFRTAVELIARRFNETINGEIENEGKAFYEAQLSYREYLPQDPSDQDVACLIEKAKTDSIAFKVLELLDFLTKDSSKNLPSLHEWKVQKYLGQYQAPRQPTGTSKYKNVLRDTFIVSAINSLIGLDFNATRNKGKPGSSACDVVVDALAALGQDVKYDAVEHVWQRRELLVQPVLLTETIEEVLENCPKR